MIKSIQKAVDILLYLSNEPEKPVALHDIARDLDINKTTCYHILETLQESLLVEKISRREGYRLGPTAYMLTRYGRYQESLVEICTPVIRWLNKQLDESVLLSVACDGIKYIIMYIDGDERFDFKDSEIVRGSLETTATGQMMMAYMDAENLSRVYDRCKQRGCAIQEQEAFARRLKAIRQQGYAHVDNVGEQRQSFAFRIWDGKRTVGAIGVLYANRRDSPQMRQRVIGKGKIAAQEISRRLIFREADDKAEDGEEA